MNISVSTISAPTNVSASQTTQPVQNDALGTTAGVTHALERLTCSPTPPHTTESDAKRIATLIKEIATITSRYDEPARLHLGGQALEKLKPEQIGLFMNILSTPPDARDHVIITEKGAESIYNMEPRDIAHHINRIWGTLTHEEQCAVYRQLTPYKESRDRFHKIYPFFLEFEVRRLRSEAANSLPGSPTRPVVGSSNR